MLRIILLVVWLIWVTTCNVIAAQSIARTKEYCFWDYLKYCSQHPIGSPGLPKCMSDVGVNLSKNCVQAMVLDGLITKEQVIARALEQGYLVKETKNGFDIVGKVIKEPRKTVKVQELPPPKKVIEDTKPKEVVKEVPIEKPKMEEPPKKETIVEKVKKTYAKIKEKVIQAKEKIKSKVKAVKVTVSKPKKVEKKVVSKSTPKKTKKKNYASKKKSKPKVYVSKKRKNTFAQQINNRYLNDGQNFEGTDADFGRN